MNNYFTVMDRQQKHVERAMEKARADGIEILFHIDADELLAVKDKSGLALALLAVPRGTACIHMQNREAVYNRNMRCFEATAFRDCQHETCTSYGNGKSAAVLRNRPIYHGPHYFRGQTYEMPPDRLAVLHYDSCTFEQWKSKFQRMAKQATRKEEIPFEFYRRSIELIQSGASDADLLAYYKQQKWKA